MDIHWYHWATLGLLMVASELALPTLVLVWFGCGAFVMAILVGVQPELSLFNQLLIWGALSIALVLAWFKFFKSRIKTLSGRSSAEAVGEVGLLVNDISEFQKSKVRFQTPVIGADVWDCVADHAIKAGTRVKVISVEGTILKIDTTEA